VTVKLVVLAAGRGTRMRAAADVVLDDGQSAAADRGLKALVPFHGEPFLAHVLTVAAGAGVREACIVVGPGDDPVHAEFAGRRPGGLAISFAVQEAPRGSADALLAAEAFAAGDDFLLINSDNHYPREAYAALRDLRGPGLAAFTGAGLVRGGIRAERLAAYALVEVNADGALHRIIEKPDAAQVAALGGDALFSMTCWRFGRRIFDACRAIAPSARGELEIPDAVMHAKVASNETFAVVPLAAPVLDLSSRSDIPMVAAALYHSLDRGSVCR
jgi:dTDP-glucose pyrophosphorylase